MPEKSGYCEICDKEFNRLAQHNRQKHLIFVSGNEQSATCVCEEPIMVDKVGMCLTCFRLFIGEIDEKAS